MDLIIVVQSASEKKKWKCSVTCLSLKSSQLNGPFWSISRKDTIESQWPGPQALRWPEYQSHCSPQLACPILPVLCSSCSSLTVTKNPALTQRKGVTLILGGHHADSHPVSKYWTLIISGFQGSITGRCSKWIWNYFFILYNKILRIAFYLVVQPLQPRGSIK